MPACCSMGAIASVAYVVKADLAWGSVSSLRKGVLSGQLCLPKACQQCDDKPTIPGPIHSEAPLQGGLAACEALCDSCLSSTFLEREYGIEGSIASDIHISNFVLLGHTLPSRF